MMLVFCISHNTNRTIFHTNLAQGLGIGIDLITQGVRRKGLDIRWFSWLVLGVIVLLHVGVDIVEAHESSLPWLWPVTNIGLVHHGHN